MFAFRRSPIIDAERRCLARAPHPGGCLGSAGAGAVGLAGALGLVGGMLALFFARPRFGAVSEFEALALLVFVVVLLVTHYRALFITLRQSAAAAARERRDAPRWDALALTPISARTLVAGKWWVIVRERFPDYVYLGVLRAVAVLWIARLLGDSTTGDGLVLLLTSLMTAGVVLALTLLNAPFTAACGVWAGMQAPRHALGTALAVRVAIPVAAFFAAFITLTLTRPAFYADGAGLPGRALALGVQALGDNGFALAYNLSAVPYAPDFPLALLALLGTACAALLYALVTAALLELARSAALDAGAL